MQRTQRERLSCRKKEGQEDKMIGQMLNEMEVIERLDWFKEIYLKF